MPDLITHTLFVTPAIKIYPKNIIFILIGALLPDLLGRTLGVFITNSNYIGTFQTVIHTPLALILFTYSFSFVFPQKERGIIFIYLLFGITSHLFLDLFQKGFGIGYLWFFPFSFFSPQIPLIWPDDTIYVIPFLLIANIVLCAGYLVSSLKKTQK